MMDIMKEVYFDKLLNRSRMLLEEVGELAIKQLSRCRYVIQNNECLVEVLNEDEIIGVIFTNDVSVKEIRDRIPFLKGEPSLDFMKDKMSNDKISLIDFLEEYQTKNYCLGSEMDTDYCFKLYSLTKLENGMRELYHAEWIDYENQLKSGTTIYDENKVNGLWATQKHMVFKLFNEESMEHYGDKIFVLKLIPDCRYLNDGKEIIGERFEVIEKYNLKELYEVGRLSEFIYESEKEKSKKKLEEIENQLEECHNENRRLSYDINMKKKKTLIWGLLEIFVGILIGSLI